MLPVLALATTLILPTGPTGVRWNPLPPIGANCDGNAAVTLTHHQLDGQTGDTITARWTLNNPACAGQNIRIAAHDTASDQWNPDETQPLLVASGAVLASAGSITWTVPDGAHPNCRVQLDLITGDALIKVSSTSRYNTFPIGGTTSRLLAAGYAEDPDCQPTPDTTVVQRETPLPPSTPTTATPPPSWPQVDETVPQVSTPPEPAAPSTVLPVPSTVELLQQRLPDTGRGRGAVVLGSVVLGSGLLAWALSLLPLRRRTIKENQT